MSFFFFFFFLLFFFFQESLRHIVDPRLGSAVATATVPSPASQESAKETAQQVIKSTNIPHHYQHVSLSTTHYPITINARWR